MKPIMDYGPMDIRPRMVKYGDNVHPGLIENMIRLFALSLRIIS
jgi:hypothetical protein